MSDLACHKKIRAVSDLLYVSLGEITGYLTSMLTHNLNSLPTLNLCYSLDLQSSMLLTDAMDIPGREYLASQYNADARIPRSAAKYNNYVLRGAADVGVDIRYRFDHSIPDLLYLELLFAIEPRGNPNRDFWVLLVSVLYLPFDIANALFDVREEVGKIMDECYLLGKSYRKEFLTAASSSRDQRYIRLAASLMDPLIYGPEESGKPVVWVASYMPLDNKPAEARLCTLAARFLDPHTLLLSTLGCTTKCVEEAIRKPGLYGISAVLNDAAFDDYVMACVTTSMGVKGCPVAANMRALLSLYSRGAVVAQFERCMRSSLWYAPVRGSLYAFEAAEDSRTKLLRVILELCAPYELSVDPFHRFSYENLHVLPIDRHEKPMELIERNFYVRLMRAGGVPGISLCPIAKAELASHTMEKIFSFSWLRERYWGMSPENKEYAARYFAIAGPAETDWLISVLKSALSLQQCTIFTSYIWALDIMAGKTPG